MGIPGYFYKYANRYPDTIIKRKLELIDALFHIYKKKVD